MANLQVNNAPPSFGQDAISKVLTNQYIHALVCYFGLDRSFEQKTTFYTQVFILKLAH